MNGIKRNTIVAVAGLLALVGLSMSDTSQAETGNVVLWNKLGSTAEVTNSEVGLDGSIMGNSYAYEPAKFGNGYVRKALWNWIEFPGQIMTSLAQKGDYINVGRPQSNATSALRLRRFWVGRPPIFRTAR